RLGWLAVLKAAASFAAAVPARIDLIAVARSQLQVLLCAVAVILACSSVTGDSLASKAAYADPLQFDPDDVVAGGGDSKLTVDKANGSTIPDLTEQAGLPIGGLCFDGGGNLYVAKYPSHVVFTGFWKYDENGQLVVPPSPPRRTAIWRRHRCVCGEPRRKLRDLRVGQGGRPLYRGLVSDLQVQQ